MLERAAAPGRNPSRGFRPLVFRPIRFFAFYAAILGVVAITKLRFGISGLTHYGNILKAGEGDLVPLWGATICLAFLLGGWVESGVEAVLDTARGSLIPGLRKRVLWGTVKFGLLLALCVLLGIRGISDFPTAIMFASIAFLGYLSTIAAIHAVGLTPISTLLALIMAGLVVPHWAFPLLTRFQWAVTGVSVSLALFTVHNTFAGARLRAEEDELHNADVQAMRTSQAKVDPSPGDASTRRSAQPSSATAIGIASHDATWRNWLAAMWQIARQVRPSYVISNRTIAIASAVILLAFALMQFLRYLDLFALIFALAFCPGGLSPIQAPSHLLSRRHRVFIAFSGLVLRAWAFCALLLVPMLAVRAVVLLVSPPGTTGELDLLDPVIMSATITAFLPLAFLARWILNLALGTPLNRSYDFNVFANFLLGLGTLFVVASFGSFVNSLYKSGQSEVAILIWILVVPATHLLFFLSLKWRYEKMDLAHAA